MVPFSVSADAMVKGIRSPPASARTITKCPGFRALATAGASTISLTTFSEKKDFSKIRFINIKIRYAKILISRELHQIYLHFGLKYVDIRLLKFINSGREESKRHRLIMLFNIIVIIRKCQTEYFNTKNS